MQELEVDGCLMTYTPMQQHYGTWLGGYRWDAYGCGTYREPVSRFRAEALLKRFWDRMERKTKLRVPYVAALEGRFSGCGDSPVSVHWHFVAACDSPGLANAMQRLWSEKFGNAKIVAYDPDRDGAYYVSKLAGHCDGELRFDGLDRLAYTGPADLIEAARQNPYVPDHLKDTVFGKYLTVRDPRIQ